MRCKVEANHRLETTSILLSKREKRTIYVSNIQNRIVSSLDFGKVLEYCYSLPKRDNFIE